MPPEVSFVFGNAEGIRDVKLGQLFEHLPGGNAFVEHPVRDSVTFHGGREEGVIVNSGPTLSGLSWKSGFNR